MESSLDYESRVEILERALLQSQCLAVAGQFAAAVMHEINNPLAAVSNLNFLVQHQSEDPFQVRAYSGMIEEQLGRVIEICRRTLSFYRTADTIEAIPLASLADAALRVHHSTIMAKQIQISLDFPNDTVVEVHAGEMLEVMSNLVGNAVDALSVRGSLRLRARKRVDRVHVTVADNGHGIPPALMDRIFDPFFTTKKEKGTGLGLAISKEIVERHRGKIKIKSSVRRGRSGTAFLISLPLQLDKGKASNI